MHKNIPHDCMNHNIIDLQGQLGYFFKDDALLKEALYHPSLKQHNGKPSINYERLEFLGDTILNFIMTEAIFMRFRSKDEGVLAPIRAYLVCKDTICTVAAPLMLGEYIVMTKGEELSGGRNNPNNIENVMEAIIAAIYLDGGMEKVRQVVLSLWDNILLQNLMSMITDYKSSLQEWSQEKFAVLPQYSIVSKAGNSHEPWFKVMVRVIGTEPEYGEGRSIKVAEKMAAERMWLRNCCIVPPLEI